MTYILCLAHYCDTHGPTPLMVTEGLRSPCSVCFQATAAPTEAGSLPRGPTLPPPRLGAAVSLHDNLRDAPLTRHGPVPVPDQDAHAQSIALRQTTAASGSPHRSSSPLETPPDSPRSVFMQSRRDSSFRRTYDETVTKKQGPCDSCAMTLPRRQDGAGSDLGLFPGDRGPTLRTRTPVERVFSAAPVYQASPPNSQSSSDNDADGDPLAGPAPRLAGRPASQSSSSTSWERPSQHLHYVSYTSTHEPLLADSFSLIRASCLRALSFETLPRAPSTSTPASSPQLTHSPSFVTTQSPGSAATGGAIFFGDAMAGYTTAYIFRIPDLHARGHKRVYAFLSLCKQRERLAMKTFAMVSAAFRDLATWIQQLAEVEVERSRESSPVGNPGPAPAPSQQPPPPPPSSALESPVGPDRTGTSTTNSASTSFLTGGSSFIRRPGGPGGVSSLKARGLAELVGQPDFFVELHGRFVRLLLELGVALNS